VYAGGFLFLGVQSNCMKEQLVDAWRTNNKISLLFIELIDDQGMKKTLSHRGGRTVYEQLVHLQSVRTQWLHVIDKKIAARCKNVQKGEPNNKDVLYEAFEDSGKGLEDFIHESWEKGGKVNNYKKGLIPFITYLIAHEAHHRGNVLLTLKECGVKIPDELKWGIWDWNKI
jgi:uncharacterized damage-inducible protein DinB